MSPTAAGIAYMVLDVVLTLVMCAMCWYFNSGPENAEGGQGQVAAQAAAAPVVQMRAAPVVKVKLRYFPYSTLGRRALEKLVCAICLDEFLHGEACGEVPACCHFFHRRCVDVWKKSSHTCPLCRRYMATGPERISAADDMV